MRIILSGASGLIGSRFEELLFESHDIIPLSSEHGVDITNQASLAEFFLGKGVDVVIHLAGLTDVDACELDREDDMSHLAIDPVDILNLDVKNLYSDDWKDKKTTFAVNSIGTKNLYEVATKSGAKFVYISSDFVFSGKEGPYNEESTPNPVDWYGMTKYFGEKVVDTASNLIVRLSFPYGHQSPVKKDVVWKLYDILSSRKEVNLISDQIITPTFIDDIIYGLDFLLSKNATGIYHLTGSSSASPMQIGEKIKEVFSLSTKIEPCHLEDVYKDKAPRPLKSVMESKKIANLGFKTKTFDEGLALIATT